MSSGGLLQAIYDDDAITDSLYIQMSYLFQLHVLLRHLVL